MWDTADPSCSNHGELCVSVRVCGVVGGSGKFPRRETDGKRSDVTVSESKWLVVTMGVSKL